MTDHKFTDEEIIKALECCKMPVGSCACNNCPLDYQRKKRLTRSDKSCTTLMFDYTLALINRQKAEIEKLNDLYVAGLESLRLAAEANKDMQAEIERLQKYNTDVAFKHYNDGIKEFAERLKSDLGRIPQHQFTRSQVEWSINTFVKEMTEENK